MKLTIDCYTGLTPKRGDIVQTNVGNRRERTLLVLKARSLKPVKAVPRYSVWAERWWELEPDLRIKLHQSAERNGVQNVIHFYRYPGKKKNSFEQHMRRERE